MKQWIFSCFQVTPVTPVATWSSWESSENITTSKVFRDFMTFHDISWHFMTSFGNVWDTLKFDDLHHFLRHGPDLVSWVSWGDGGDPGDAVPRRVHTKTITLCTGPNEQSRRGRWVGLGRIFFGWYVTIHCSWQQGLTFHAWKWKWKWCVTINSDIEHGTPHFSGLPEFFWVHFLPFASEF